MNVPQLRSAERRALLDERRASAVAENAPDIFDLIGSEEDRVRNGQERQALPEAVRVCAEEERRHPVAAPEDHLIPIGEDRNELPERFC